MYINKVGEEYFFNGFASMELSFHIHTFTASSQALSRLFGTRVTGYLGYDSVTGYKIFLGTMKGIRDMRHLGRISRGVERMHIHWRLEETAGLWKKYSPTSCCDHLSVVSDHLCSATSFPPYQTFPGQINIFRSSLSRTPCKEN